MKLKKKNPKFQWIPMLHLQVMHNYVYWHCSIDYCVEVSLVDKTLWENCSHFTLRCFLLNSFVEMCLLQEISKKMHKIQILTFLRTHFIWNIKYWSVSLTLRYVSYNRVSLWLLHVGIWEYSALVHCRIATVEVAAGYPQHTPHSYSMILQ